jgi:hypothetical protein
MNMRRLPVWLAVLAAVTLLAAGVSSLVLTRVTTRVAGNVVRATVESVIERVVPAACAAEKLQFKPVPPESSASFEQARRRARDRRPEPVSADSEASLPASPRAPEAPDAPRTAGRTGNMMRVGSDIEIESDQVVAGDVLAVGGDVVVRGQVEGDVVAMGGDISLESTAKVDGDVVTMGGQLHEEDGAYVGGRRVTTSGLSKDDWSRTRRRGHVGVDADDDSDHGGVPGAVVWMLVWMLVAWLFTALAPGRTGTALAGLKREGGASALIGLLSFLLAVPALIAVVVVMVLLCITIIGIPLGLALLFGYFAFLGILWSWGYVIGAAALGERVLTRGGGTASLVRSAVIGVLIVDGAFVILEAMQWVPGFRGLSTFLKVMVWCGSTLLCMLGSGAWLRHEFREGRFGRWWRGRTGGGAPQWNAPAPAAAMPDAAGGGVSSRAWSASTPPPPAPPPPPPSTGPPPSYGPPDPGPDPGGAPPAPVS